MGDVAVMRRIPSESNGEEKERICVWTYRDSNLLIDCDEDDGILFRMTSSTVAAIYLMVLAEGFSWQGRG